MPPATAGGVQLTSAAVIGKSTWRAPTQLKSNRLRRNFRGKPAAKRKTAREALGPGSFYLAAAVVMIAVLLTAAKVLPPLIIPLVIVGAVVLLSVVGALQLRQDEKLAEKNFLQLMSMALALRFIGARGTPAPQKSQPDANAQTAAEHRAAPDGRGVKNK